MNHFEKILTEYEIKVLRVCAGLEEPGLIDGAALWQTVEILKGYGLIEEGYKDVALQDGTFIQVGTGAFTNTKGLEVLSALGQGEET